MLGQQPLDLIGQLPIATEVRLTLRGLNTHRIQ